MAQEKVRGSSKLAPMSLEELQQSIGAARANYHLKRFREFDPWAGIQRLSTAIIFAIRSASAPMVREGLTPSASGIIAASAT